MTKYTVVVDLAGHVWELSKRYSDFDALWTELRRWLHWSELPALPKKGMPFLAFGQLEKPFLEERRAGLEQAMAALLARGDRTLMQHGPGALIETFLGLRPEAQQQYS